MKNKKLEKLNEDKELVWKEYIVDRYTVQGVPMTSLTRMCKDLLVGLIL